MGKAWDDADDYCDESRYISFLWGNLAARSNLNSKRGLLSALLSWMHIWTKLIPNFIGGFETVSQWLTSPNHLNDRLC